MNIVKFKIGKLHIVKCNFFDLTYSINTKFADIYFIPTLYWSPYWNKIYFKFMRFEISIIANISMKCKNCGTICRNKYEADLHCLENYS